MRKRGQWIVVAVVAVGTMAALAVVGVVIANQQHAVKQSQLRRFDQRAQISAALTQSLFGSLASISTTDLEQRFSGPAGQLQDRLQDLMAKSREQATKPPPYVAILDGQGTVLAGSGSVPGNLTNALSAAAATMTNVQHTSRGPSVGYLLPFPLPAGGQRVFAEGVPLGTVQMLLNAYLQKLPNPDGADLWLTDATGAVLAHTTSTQSRRDADEAMVSATVAVPSTDWQLRLTAPRALALPGNAWLHWLPWLLLAALGGSVVSALALYRRLIRTAARERHAYGALAENRQQLATLVGVLEDIADRDSLTGLWNRRRFDRELGGQIARCRRLGEPAALLILDVDGFKHINDTFGHSRGDAVLRAIAHGLTGRLRETDGAARIGGDEFAVLLVGATPEDARRLAGELSDELTGISRAEARDLPVSLSVGVAILDAATVDAGAAFDAADQDMYTAKARRQPVLREPLPRQRLDGVITSPWV